MDNENNILNQEMVDKIVSEVSKKMKTKSTGSWMSKLLDKDNEKVSSSNFYLISVTIVGLLLLIVPMIVLIIEAIYNHTVATDLNGMAAYIASVATLFATGGVVKGWINYNDNKTKRTQIEHNSSCCEESECQINEDSNN